MENIIVTTEVKKSRKKPQKFFYSIKFSKNNKQFHERIFKEPRVAAGYKNGIISIFPIVEFSMITSKQTKGKKPLIR
jgi:hypothetical protein